MATTRVRQARENDSPLLMELIREFAVHVGAPFEAREEDLRQSLFHDRKAEVLIGEKEGDVVGYVLYFQSYSTFQAKSALFIEDLYVRERFRKDGCGREFMRRLAAVAVERGCRRIEWCCQDHNANAIGFYLNVGAVRLDGLGVYRLADSALTTLAEGS